MPKLRIILLTLAAAGGWSAPALAADQPRCLNQEQRRAAIANKQAIPLGRAVRAVRARGEVVRARLCEGNPGLVYMLTLLARNGKVTRATVDATNGQLLSGR
jgi:uncharacterized membrane protein YkoI